MALFSSHTSMVQRSSGQNAIAAAAYNSRSQLTLWKAEECGNEVVQLTWNYSSKEGLAYSKIHAPNYAPNWVYDRELLWNKAEAAELRVDGQPARKIMVALPSELSAEQNIDLLEEFTSKLVELSMVVDVNMHMDHPENPHAHLMMTTRPLTENKYGEYELSRLKNRDWGKVAFVNWHRELWAELTNTYLHKYGFEERVTHKSYKQLGLDIEAGKHEGPARNIKRSELRRLNQEIALNNAKKIDEQPSLILDKLAINRPVFTKDDIAKELDKVLFAGTSFDGVSSKEKSDLESTFHKDLASKYMQLYTRIMDSAELALVTTKDLYGRALYTTTKRLQLEQRYIENVEGLQNSAEHLLRLTAKDLNTRSHSELIKDAVIGTTRNISELLEQKTGIKFDLLTKAPHKTLSNEQSKAVLEILQGRDISVLEGIPGSGKTTAMREIVRQYKQRGYKVIGVAPSSSAALQLEKETGIESKNASLWRKEWLAARGHEFELVLKGDYYTEEKYQDDSNSITSKQRTLSSHNLLSNKHVMIIDEASMGELSNMDYLISEARKAKAKVILVGDDNQLSAVGFAGALKKTISICGSSRLEESRRQNLDAHQAATKLLAKYKVEDALNIYRKEGHIIIDSDTRCSDRHLVSDYIDAYLQKVGQISNDNVVADRQLVVCTYTNNQSSKFNSLIRAQLKEAGVIKGKISNVVVGSKSLELGVGEQIVFTRNLNQAGKSGIYNGEVGTVLNIKNIDEYGHALVSVLVSKADGSKEGITIDTSAYPKGAIFNYGYAVTAHKLQGATVDSAYIAHEKQMGFETINVLLTRHRSNVRLYTSHDILPDYAREHAGVEASSLDKATFNILVALLSRRVNNSMSVDYKNIGLSQEDQLLSEYIEHSSKAIELIQKITSDNARKSKMEQKAPPIYAHELWDEFKTTKEVRDRLAGFITGNIDQYKDRLQQLNINQHSLLRHAGIGLEASTTNQSNTKQDQMVHNDYTYYHSLIDAIEENDSIDARHQYIALQEKVTALHLGLEQSFAKGVEIKDEKLALEDSIYAEQNFRTKLMPSFISRIYKHGPFLVLEKWTKLVQEHGVDKAAKIVGKKPQLLGEVRGKGIGMLVSLDQERREVLLHYKNLTTQLKAYSKSYIIEEESVNKHKEGGYAAKLEKVQQEIELLKSQLPTELQEAFLQEVGNTIGKYGSQDKNLAEMKDSNLFKAVSLQSGRHSSKESSLEQNDHNYLNQNMHKAYKDFRQKNKEKQIRLEYHDVKQHLNNSIIEQIFLDHSALINPDGKLKRNNSQLSCGSLNINLHNGLWHRFSDSSSGDIFTLVEEAKSVSKLEALSIVANYCGIEQQLEANSNSHSHPPLDPQAYLRTRSIDPAIERTQHIQKIINKDPWQVVDLKALSHQPDFTPSKDLEYLTKKADIEHSYEYRSEAGHLLGLTLRIKDADTGKKQVLPVTYCYNKEQDKYSWRLKGFSDNKHKPIYGLEKLLNNEVQKPILIVEGEKTADKAQELLPDHVVLSWMGGTSSANKANWSKLQGRDVVIWPDNDNPGIKAATTIKEHIDHANGFSGMCHIVDTGSLNLPEKWDLADMLPSHIKHSELSAIIDNSKAPQLSIAEQCHITTQQSQDWRKLLSSLDMLIAKGRVDDAAYSDFGVTNKELYKDTLAVMASNKGLDITDKDNFIDNIRNLQQEYSKQIQYCNLPQSAYISFAGNSQFGEERAMKALKEVTIYQQVLLKTEKLIPIHQESLVKAWKQHITKPHSNELQDILSASSKLYTEIKSQDWHSKIDDKHQQLFECSKGKEHSNNITTALQAIEKQYVLHQELGINKAPEYDPQGNHQDIIAELHKAAKHALEHGVMTDKQLLNKLHAGNDPHETHQFIKEMCQDHHVSKVRDNLNAMLEHPGKALHVGEHHFTCPMDYLKHEIEHPSHSYVDAPRLTKAIPKIEHHMQQQMENHQQHEMVK